MVVMGQLCRRWGLPTVGMSFGGDAKDADEQAALEAGYYGFGSVLGAIDMVFDAGCVEGGLLFSPELLVISDELAGMTRKAVEPIEVSDETIAFDVIRSVGPGNTFLGADHTLAHFRELWLPKILSWEGRLQWETAGAKTLRQRARDKVFDVWANHSVPSLPDDVLIGMQAVIEARRAATARV